MSSIDTWDEIAGVEKFDLKIPTSHESDLNVRRSGDSIFCAPRRVRELLIQCIQGKRGEDYLFTRENGMPVKDFRGSWAKVCEEAGLPGLHFHDLRRTAARNMRRGHVAEKVAMEIGGWKTTSVFHRYAIVDNQDIANAMEMLERSQDEQRQRLEGLVTKAERPLANNVASQKNSHQPTTLAISEKSALTSRLRHVEGAAGVSGRLHRGTSRTRKPICKRDLGVGAGRGSRTPKTRRSADFESAAYRRIAMIIKRLYYTRRENV